MQRITEEKMQIRKKLIETSIPTVFQLLDPETQKKIETEATQSLTNAKDQHKVTLLSLRANSLIAGLFCVLNDKYRLGVRHVHIAKAFRTSFTCTSIATKKWRETFPETYSELSLIETIEKLAPIAFGRHDAATVQNVVMKATHCIQYAKAKGKTSFLQAPLKGLVSGLFVAIAKEYKLKPTSWAISEVFNIGNTVTTLEHYHRWVNTFPELFPVAKATIEQRRRNKVAVAT